MKLKCCIWLKDIARSFLLYLTSKEWIRVRLRRLSLYYGLPSFLWKRLPVNSNFIVSINDRVKFTYCSTSPDTIGRALYWKGLKSWEADTIPIYYSIAKDARIVLDIGANTGFYSLLACAANPYSEVFAFEPVPKVFARLSTNIFKNNFQNRCHALEFAVSNSIGFSDFCELEGGIPTSSSFNVNGFRGYKGNVYKVKTTTIDAMSLIPFNKVDLVKIDVEGYEDIVLEGMKVLFENCRPSIIIECNYDGPFLSVERILKGYGYNFYHITSDGLKYTDRISPDLTGKFLNFLCLPSDN